jgi:hypothetical protein
MMNKKMIPHIIAVTVLLCSLMLFAACVSLSGSTEVQTYEMQLMPGSNSLQGKKAVVFDIALAEKILPQSAAGTDGGGGLLGLAIAAGANAIDLSNFKKSATNETWLKQETDAFARKQESLYSAFSARYAELNAAETVRSSFNFNGAAPTLDYFSNASADSKAKIAAACAENGADFAVTMIAQIVYAETLITGPISAPTTIVVEICLFDKSGTLVSQGKTETVSYSTSGRGPNPVINLLIDDASENIVLMLPALGGNGEKIGSKEYVPPVIQIDTGDTREAGANETVLIVKRVDSVRAWPADLLVNPGTESDRLIPIAAKGEIRVVIPNGETVLEAQVPVTGKDETNDPVTFTASGGQITYTLSVKGTMGAGSLGANERFTWKQE